MSTLPACSFVPPAPRALPPARPAAALPDVELLARLLDAGRAGARARRAAARLLAERPLEAWARLLPDACAAEAERALGDAPAARPVTALFELARRALGPPPGVEMARPEDVVPWLAEWRDARREHFVAFDLNARHQMIARRLVSVGSLSASIVHPREVFQPAVSASAAGLIVAHNHPSGDPEPSPEDVAVTRRLREAGELLGIELLDHLVVAGRGSVSLKARGCL
ncbi:MAG: JAB domain-containing protein [Candidatus Eisenbacteria bacterium]